MSAFDFILIAIVAMSLSLGMWRGVIHELLSILGWPLAFLASWYGATMCAAWMPGQSDATRQGLAYVVVFVAVLLAWAVLVFLLTKLVQSFGLGWLNRLLGGLFGVWRGLLIALVLVWGAGMTQLPQQPFWREAKFSRLAEQVAMLTKVWLPDNIAQRIHYRVVN